MREILVNNLSVFLEKTAIINHLSMCINRSSFITVLSDDDRTSQAFLLSFSGLIPYSGEIFINHVLLKKERAHFHKISFVFSNQFRHLWGYTVRELLSSKIKKSPHFEEKTTFEQLKIESLLDCKIEFLSASQKQLVSLLDVYLENPKILLLEDPFSRMDKTDKKIAFNFLKKLNKENQTIIIHFTNNVEDILLGKEVCLLKKGEILKMGKVQYMIYEEKSFLEIGYDLPFLPSLSHKLSYYNLIDKPLLTEKEMIDILWK